MASALFPPGFFNKATCGLRIKDGKAGGTLPNVPTGVLQA